MLHSGIYHFLTLSEESDHFKDNLKVPITAMRTGLRKTECFQTASIQFDGSSVPFLSPTAELTLVGLFFSKYAEPWEFVATS